MENDTDNNWSNSEVLESRGNTKQPTRKGINLLKRSKQDLLRLLSILEGELEARDIYISTLKAQLNNQKNAKHQYFVHRLNDPFLSLHRDDHIAGSGDGKLYSNELAHIEPLPLLEKIVFQFKNQQQKMHHQMSLASKIHRKMAHELAEEKRKHAFDAKTGDDVTMALEKEKERLQARVLCEKEKTKRIEKEYKKLLSLCKEEGKRHKIIVMSLLVEQDKLLQQLKQSKELQIDVDSTETELQARLHQALKDKQKFAGKLKEEQSKSEGLQSQIMKLQTVAFHNCQKSKDSTQPKVKSALEQATALYGSEDQEDFDDSDEDEDSIVSAPELPVKMSRAASAPAELLVRAHRSSNPETTAFFNKHHPMSVAQSTQDVTLIPTSCHPPILLADGVGVTTSGYYSVKPGSSIAGLEAMKSTATSKEILSLDFVSDDVFETANIETPKLNCKDKRQADDSKSANMSFKAMPPKPNRFIPGTPQYIPFRSPHSLFNDKTQTFVTSSPTSGAANFAMNSPNMPNPPQSSPFAIARSPTVKPVTKVAHGKNESTPKKISSFTTKLSAPTRITSKTGQNTQFQTTRMKFQNIPTVNSDNDVSKESLTDRTPEQKQKKFNSATYKSQITQRISGSTTLPTVVTSIKSDVQTGSEIDKPKQPLPPKTRPSSSTQGNGNQVRPPPLPPKKPSLSSDTPPKQRSSSLVGKSSEPAFQRKSGSVIKRVSPLSQSTKGKENSNNGSISKINKSPMPPTLPAKMSSQHPTPPAGPRQNHSVLSRSTSSES